MKGTYILKNGEKISVVETKQSFFTRFIVNTLALGASAYIINDFYINSFFHLMIAGLIFTFLNSIVKPLVVFMMLPVLILSLGILYPLVNVIVINILDVIMGSNLIIEGTFNAIIVSIIVSVVNYAVTNLYK
ncbi:MAG: phage holin family protein [Bacilli bacterium]